MLLNIFHRYLKKANNDISYIALQVIAYFQAWAYRQTTGLSW